MRLTLLNLTNESIRYSHGAGKKGSLLSADQAILPSSRITVEIPKLCFKLALTSTSPSDGSTLKEKSTTNPDGIVIPVRMAFSLSRKASIPVPAGSPWRIYRTKVSRAHHRLSIFASRDLSAFLSEMADTTPLSSLLLPGTHDTMAFYGWPISQCQTTALSLQLQKGIRCLDIRLAVVESRLIAYHGSFPEKAPFQEILSTVHTFLTTSTTSRETIVMSIKQEDFEKTPPETFSKLVHDEIFSGPGGREMWFFENRIPNLGEVRGKVVMLSRFGGNGDGWEGGLEGLGIHPTTWPDSQKAGFSWQCKNTLVRTHDWYKIPSFLSIPEKVTLATSVLLPPVNDPPMPTLSISYFSAASIPLALPPTIAKGGLGIEGVNSRVCKWLLDLHDASEHSDAEKKEDVSETRIRGWAFVDFCEDPDALVPLFVECNFRE